MGSQVPGTEAAHSLDGGIRVGGGGVLFICCWQNPGSKLERRMRQTPSREGVMAGGDKGQRPHPSRRRTRVRGKVRQDWHWQPGKRDNGTGKRTDDVRTAGVGACVSVLLSRTWSRERYQLSSSTGRRRVGCHQAAQTGRKPSWTPGPSRSTPICHLSLSAPTSIDGQSPGMASFFLGRERGCFGLGGAHRAARVRRLERLERLEDSLLQADRSRGKKDAFRAMVLQVVAGSTNQTRVEEMFVKRTNCWRVGDGC